MRLILFSLFLIVAPAAWADEDRFVENNLLAVLYHELGHALIDILELPIFGQEEDAADVLSVLLTHDLWEEDAAVEIAYDSAFGYLGEAEALEAEGEEVSFWGVHGPDLQRYYNLVCLFYGANPNERDDVAEELGLPEDRAESCEEEFDQAQNSWGQVMAELEEGDGTGRFVLFTQDPDEVTARIMAAELADLNEIYRLPQDIPVLVEPCDEPNAFYDPEAQEITMCTEFAPHLAGLWQDL